MDRVCREMPVCVRLVSALILGLLLLVPSYASAQAVTGTLLGNITDSSGAAVPGATVTARETQTNVSRSAVTNETGYYILTSIQNGNYTVEAELQGFKKVIREGVKVDVNTTVRVDLKLEVGQLTESVEVSAETPLLQTDRTDTGRIIESKMVAELPLTFNRNFQALMVTVPGVTRPHREHSQFFNSQDSLRYEVNGQPGMASTTLIEGLDDNHKTGLLQVIIPAADALETVAVTTSNYDAEFGRAGGAVTNVTLKSGTNELKGSGFVFANNEKTVARDALTKTVKAPTSFFNGGFTLGGPIVKSKLFFFGDYQRTLDNNGYVVRATIPTMAMRNGDFSAVTQGIYDPFTGDINGNGRVRFANNQIPQERISPIARRLLALIPAPNIPTAALGQTNFEQAAQREKTTDGFDAKVNHSLNEKDSMSYRMSFMRPVVFDPGAFGEYGGPANGGFAGTGTNTSYSTGITWTRVISANTVLDVRGGLNYYHNVTSTTGQTLQSSKDVGIPGANLNDYTNGISTININGHTGPLLGFSSSQPWDRWEKTWNGTATLTRLLNSHTIKLGTELRHNSDMLLQTQDAGGPRGSFTFNASGTGSPAETASTTGIANPMASFLLDWPSDVRRDLKVFDNPGTKHWGTFWYIQDKWQARSNITVDLGLRWEYYTPLVGLEGKGTLANYDPEIHSIRVSGYGDQDNAVNVKKNFSNFSPRTGVSWRVTQLDVVRAGYGESTIPFPDNRYAFNYPVKQNYVGATPNPFQRAGSLATGFPDPVLLDIPDTGIVPVAGTALQNATLDVISSDLHEGTLRSWNVAYQRQLPFLLTAEAAYVGNRGVDLVMDLNTNASMTYNTGNNGRPYFARFNRQGENRTRTNLGKTTYHGLQMKIDRRWRNGLLVTNSYTYGKAMNYVDENGGIGTPIDFALSWGLAGFNRKHQWVATSVYELPWGPNKKWLSNGLLGQVIGGWQLSGIFTAQSGQPLNIGGNALLNTPGNTAFVNLNGENKVLGGLGPGKQYFDPTVYSLPPAGVQGNMTRNSGPEGPGFWQLDGSLFKRFAVGGGRYAEIRADAYNVTNSIRWGNPNTGFSTATGNTFGQINGTTGLQRSVRFGARFVF